MRPAKIATKGGEWRSNSFSKKKRFSLEVVPILTGCIVVFASRYLLETLGGQDEAKIAALKASLQRKTHFIAFGGIFRIACALCCCVDLYCQCGHCLCYGCLTAAPSRHVVWFRCVTRLAKVLPCFDYCWDMMGPSAWWENSQSQSCSIIMCMRVCVMHFFSYFYVRL